MTSAAAQTAQTVTEPPPEVILRIMLTPNQAIGDFTGDCRRLGWSERSIATYERTLYQFAERLPRDQDVSKITTEDLRRYLATKRHLAPGTVAGLEAHLSSWLKWLHREHRIVSSPMDRLVRTKRIPPEDLDVLTVSTGDVLAMLAAAEPGCERNALATLAYLGPRRRATAHLRLHDYNQATGELRFREKGGKTIWKPIPAELRQVLDASIRRGDIWDPPHDYLIPPRSRERSHMVRIGNRDDRIIWNIVKDVARRAGVQAHVHALRAAFAVFYLEQNAGDSYGLQNLMGHSNPNTTQTYLRRYDKRDAMQPVRKLSWAAAAAGNTGAAESPQTAGLWLEESAVVGAGGFEPPFPEGLGPDRDADQLPVDLLSRASDVSEPPMSGLADSKEGE